MFFDDDDLSSLLGGLPKEPNKQNFFEMVDEKSIIGRNMLMNYVGKIGNEIQMMGYSDTSLEIAEFYEVLKAQGKINEFFSNGVIKFIREIADKKPSVKNYLEERLFDDMELEYREFLEKTFADNDTLHERITQDVQEFKKKQILESREIKKIMEQRNCTEEQAKAILAQQKAQDGINQLTQALFGMSNDQLTNTTIKRTIKKGLDNQVSNGIMTGDTPKAEPNTNFVSFDDIDVDTDNGSDDTFF